MSPRDGLAAGTVLGGRFRILRAIGAGTMGTVYEVEHLLTRHRRALKLLAPALRAHPETWARFQREASIAARLASPHVTEVHDAGELEDGQAYVLMELLEGEDLGALLARRGPLPLPELAALVRAAALGLHAAHEAGIVHRDVKPANLFVCEDGRVKVLDFGICRFDPELTRIEPGTQDPAALGTPAYMAPEQVRGARDLDRRVDVWALGAILFLGASGARPFRARTLPELAVAVDRGRPVPRAPVAPALPPSFVAIVDRAMAMKREERFPTAAALADALASFTAASPADVASQPTATLDPIAKREPRTLDPRDLVTIEPEPPSPRPARAVGRAPLLIGIAVVALAGALLARAATRSDPAAIAPATSHPSAYVPIAVASPAPSPPPPSIPPPIPPSTPATAIAPPKPAPKASPSSALPLHRDNPYR